MKDKGLEKLCETLDECIKKLRNLSNSADATGYVPNPADQTIDRLLLMAEEKKYMAKSPFYNDILVESALEDAKALEFAADTIRGVWNN